MQLDQLMHKLTVVVTDNWTQKVTMERGVIFFVNTWNLCKYIYALESLLKSRLFRPRPCLVLPSFSRHPLTVFAIYFRLGFFCRITLCSSVATNFVSNNQKF